MISCNKFITINEFNFIIKYLFLLQIFKNKICLHCDSSFLFSRQCMCCYREIKNFDRFIRLTQSIVLCTLQQLQAIQQNEDVAKEAVEEEKEEEEKNSKRKSSDSTEHAQVEAQTKQIWSQQDRERLFHLLSKIFLLNFPLYIAMKHGGVINPLAPVKVRLFILHL